MSSRRDPKEKKSPHKRTEQGECDPVPEQQQPETDLFSGAPPTRRGIADHPNRRWTVNDPDPSGVPRPGPGHDHVVRPWKVHAVVGAPADRVDEMIDLVRDMEEPPSEGDSQTYSRQPAMASEGRRGTVNHTTGSSAAQNAPDRPNPKGSHGKSASMRQDLVDRESGISLDGFPSRSMEEGGVSRLFQRDSSDDASDFTTGATVACSSSTSSSRASDLTGDEAIIHTARAVTIHSVPADYPYHEEVAVHRLLSMAELDRMDERIEDAEAFWADVCPGMAVPAQASDENADEMLTGNRGSSSASSDRDRAPWSEGQLGPPSSAGPYHTERRPSPRVDRAGGHSTNVEHAQPRPASPTPSESSITETIFNVRQLTPPPRRPDAVTLHSSQRDAAAAAGPSGGLQRGGAHPTSDVGQGEAVPAVLVPGGGRWLGFGGSQPPPQVSRRQGHKGPDREEE